jgi:hypothetical protein
VAVQHKLGAFVVITVELSAAVTIQAMCPFHYQVLMLLITVVPQGDWLPQTVVLLVIVIIGGM